MKIPYDAFLQRGADFKIIYSLCGMEVIFILLMTVDHHKLYVYIVLF